MGYAQASSSQLVIINSTLKKECSFTQLIIKTISGLEDDPFYKARAELKTQASGKTSVPISSKTRPATATAGGTATKTARTTATKNTLPGPVKSTYHKSTVSLGSRPAGVVTRVPTSTIRRPHTVIDMNKKRDKPTGVHGALMLVKNLHDNGDIVGEDFLFDL